MTLTKFRFFQGEKLGYQYDFKTNLQDHEAIAILGQLDKEICKSFHKQYYQRKKLSPRQWYWTHLIALEATGVKVRN